MSGRIRPVVLAGAEAFGVATAFGFGLFDAADDGRCLAFSTADCVEFCLPLATVGLPPPLMTGEGARPLSLVSGKVGLIGEDAIDGDMAIDVTVLFLWDHVSKITGGSQKIDVPLSRMSICSVWCPLSLLWAISRRGFSRASCLLRR